MREIKKELELQCSCLAHVWWTEITSMRRFDIIMVGANSENPFFVNIAGVCSDLRETIPNPMMLQNCFNKETICIAHNLQLAPEHNNVILGSTIIIISRLTILSHIRNFMTMMFYYVGFFVELFKSMFKYIKATKVIYPRECAASMAGTMRGCIGVLFRTCTMSSMVFPCE